MVSPGQGRKEQNARKGMETCRQRRLLYRRSTHNTRYGCHLITGLLRRDAGEVRVLGFDLENEPHQVRQRIGLVPQETNLYADLSAVDNLWHHAALYCPDLGGVEGRMEDLLRLVSGGHTRFGWLAKGSSTQSRRG